MIETSARLLRVLSLLQSRRFWTGADLAERLEVGERTVRRDIDRLRSLGYPVDAAAGVAGGYQLGAGASLPPLLLEDDEAIAVTLGLRTAAAGTVAGVEEAALRALAKLEQVLPARLRRRLSALRASIVPMHRGRPTVDPELLTALASASRDRQVVGFRYGDRAARSSERRVEPHGLVYAGWRWYLVAWDLGREDWRTFRVDRVAGGVTADTSFAARTVPGGDLAAYVASSLSWEVYPHRARVLVEAPLEAMAPRIPLLAARLEAFDDRRCVLETGGDSLRTIALHLALLDVDFEVLEPPELRAELRALAGRFDRAAGRDQGLG